MKFYSYILFMLVMSCGNLAQAQVVLQEDFNQYQGTSATVPAGWYFSSNASYSSIQNSGKSGPNSYKFSVDSATIITPKFSDADSLYFWMKGNGIDAISKLNISASSDSINWNNIADINDIATTGIKWDYAFKKNTQYLRFIYTKSAGNIAFDDFEVVKSQVKNLPIHKADTAIAGGKIKIYFNMPVDTNRSTGVNAVYLNHTMLDTLVAYIKRAQYSIDIAQYDYISSSSTDAIASAINNAYSRGVKIRWIYDAGVSNSGLAKLNTYIDTLGRTNGGLMHHKFVVIDAKSPKPKDAIVITGSLDWINYQFEKDYNDMVILQDSLLADAYTKEFNQMWGSSGITANRANSKFGSAKNPMPIHNYNIGGVGVELFFSPEDATNNHIKQAINTADKDLYFGVYTFTRKDIANTIKARIQDDVYVAGIMDQYSQPYDAYSILSQEMGNMLQLYTGNAIYHIKMGIIDPSEPNSDPQVITGSYNWTTAAETKNDENTIIIHNPIAANMYYQSFYQNFADLGGQLENPNNINDIENNSFDFYTFPNPSRSHFNIYFSLKEAQDITIKVYDISGKIVDNLVDNEKMNPGEHQIKCSLQQSGIYIVELTTENKVLRLKIVKAV